MLHSTISLNHTDMAQHASQYLLQAFNNIETHISSLLSSLFVSPPTFLHLWIP